MAAPKRSKELKAPEGHLNRITREALARYTASDLIRPGDTIVYELIDKSRNS